MKRTSARSSLKQIASEAREWPVYMRTTSSAASTKAARSASQVLRDGRTSTTAKIAAGAALSQESAGKSKKKK
jgi:hypothetical protein